MPAVGQGCVAVECRRDDAATVELLGAVDDAATRHAVEVERSFLAELGSGCSLPVGGHVADGVLHVFLASDGAAPGGRAATCVALRARRRRPRAGATGGAPRCAARRRRMIAVSTASASRVTRPDAGELGERLAELGATVVHVPLIEIGDAADGGRRAARRAGPARPRSTGSSSRRPTGLAASASRPRTTRRCGWPRSGPASAADARRRRRTAGRPRAHRRPGRGPARRVPAGARRRPARPGRPGPARCSPTGWPRSATASSR